MGRIIKLPEDVVNRIAAGEVVERPASVVKELVENSLDADANYIEISLLAGGKELISVSDDGVGMSPEDAILALERHATSKIHNSDDLTAISTLGFRGEALPSIASVSFFELITRPHDLPLGTRIVVDHGELLERCESGAKRGTTVIVRELFSKIPARRKFLKSDRSELEQCIDVVTKLAIPYFSVGFRLEHSGSEILYLPPSSSEKERILSLFGDEIQAELIPFDKVVGECHIYGVACPRSFHRPRPDRQFFFLNRRPIKSGLLSAAVKRAYENLIPPKRHPVVFLFIEVPPELVDINVHPAKLEARFRREEVTFGSVVQALREVIGGTPSPVKSQIPFVLGEKQPSLLNPQNLEFPLPQRQFPGTKIRPNDEDLMGVLEKLTSSMEVSISEPKPKFLQLNNTYIIVETSGGILLIDQHAAHERVIFEKIMSAFENEDVVSQKLLFSAAVKLSPQAMQRVVTLWDLLLSLGFELEVVDQTTIHILAMPMFIKGDVAQLLSEVIAELGDLGDGKNIKREIATAIACKSAIKAGQTLSEDEMSALFDQLFATDDPFHCPHGRPTTVKFTLSQIEKMFGR